MIVTELDKEALDKAYKNFIEKAEFFLEKDWYIEQIEAKGFEDVELFYTCNFSQGDGLCFTSENFDFEKLGYSKTETKFLSDYVTVSYYLNGTKYFHEHAITLDIDTSGVDTSDYLQLDNCINDAIHNIEIMKYNLCVDLFRSVRDEVEYFYSTQNFIDSCNNKTQFNRDGELL